MPASNIVREFTTFPQGIATRFIKIGGNAGDFLVIGPDGKVLASSALSVDATFTGSLFLRGTDFDVLVDALTLISQEEGVIVGKSQLRGHAVFVGEDAPAVSSQHLGKVDLAAQVANIAGTNLSNTPPAGFYEVEVYIMTTTADAAAGTQAVVIGWTDNVGATTSTVIAAHSLAATGRSTGRAILRLASGDITYAVTNTGGYGTAAYAVYVRVVALG